MSSSPRHQYNNVIYYYVVVRVVAKYTGSRLGSLRMCATSRCLRRPPRAKLRQDYVTIKERINKGKKKKKTIL